MRTRTIAALVAPTIVGLGMLFAPAARADCAVTDAVLGCTPPPPAPEPGPQPAPVPAPAPQPGPQPQPAPQPQPSPQPAPAPAPSTSPDHDTATAADRLLTLANQERRAAGLPTLTRRADVDEIARQHSGAMAAKASLWHNDDYFTPASHDRLQARTLGENVAMDPSVDDMHRALMNSPHHRANILDPRFRQVGIGLVFGASGSWFATQDFVEPRATAPAPAAEAARSGGAGKPAVSGRVGGVAAAAPVVASATALMADAHGLVPDGLTSLSGLGASPRPRSGHHANRAPLSALALLSLTGVAGVGGTKISRKTSMS